MHLHRKWLVLIVLIPLYTAVFLAACEAEPTADEIVAKSRTHFEAANSFETNTVQYLFPNVDEPSNSNRMRIELPSRFLFLTPEGATRIISIDNTVYRLAEQEDGKWTRSVNENVAGGNADQLNLLVGFFPLTFFEAELVESDGETYVVEGFGRVYNNLGLPADWANWHRLKIRKSDFALMELTKFDYPTVSLGDDGEITETFEQPSDEDGTHPFAHMRTVAEVSRYNEDFGIIAPSDRDIVVEVMRTWPQDLAFDVRPRDQIGFRLSEPTAIMNLTVEPEIVLVSTEIDHPTLNEFPGVKAFKPEDIWGRDTTYTATLRWGDSQGDLKTRSWSFTTR
jgi:hypothetical protein